MKLLHLHGAALSLYTRPSGPTPAAACTPAVHTMPGRYVALYDGDGEIDFGFDAEVGTREPAAWDLATATPCVEAPAHMSTQKPLDSSSAHQPCLVCCMVSTAPGCVRGQGPS